MNYFSSFSFSFRYYTFLLSHKIDLIRLRYPLLYTLIYNSFFIIFTILLHTYLDPPHSLLCQPDTDSSVQDFTVGEEVKQLVSLLHNLPMYITLLLIIMSLFTTLPILSDEDFFDMCVNPIEIIIPHTNILK